MTVAEAIDAAGLARLVAGGFVEPHAAGIRATTAGRAVLNAVIGTLLG